MTRGPLALAWLFAALIPVVGCVGEQDLPTRVGKPCQTHADCACEDACSDAYACVLGGDQGLCVVNDEGLCDVLSDDAVLVSFDAGGPEVLDAVAARAANSYVCALDDLVLRGPAVLGLPGGQRLEVTAGSVVVEGTGMSTLSDLSRLDVVLGDVVIRDNDLLERLELTPDLEIGGRLEIVDNGALPQARVDELIERLCFCGDIEGQIRACGNGALPLGCNLPGAVKTCGDVPPPTSGCP